MLKFNLEIFNNIKNFAHIHSKRRKLGTFILFQKCQFVYTNKINSPPIRQFFPLSIFGHAMCHVPVIKRLGTRKPQDLPWGKIHVVLGLLARDMANHSYAPNTPLTQALNPLRPKPLAKLSNDGATLELLSFRRFQKCAFLSY